ncbi:MAG TPA: phosphoglucosamine mutase [Actinomycetota bacterium]|nr:phosphoglucosamine mutase [Actinomycetota bacterium]
MSRIFGTDGVRGVANTELTPELALDLGRAAASVLGATLARPRVVLARDTRISGEMLESALAAGLASAGADVIHTGILPTPSVAHLVVATGAAAGAVVSASHNPVEDNGIKFFGPDGLKLSDAVETQIEQALGSDLHRPSGLDVGRTSTLHDAKDRYIEHALAALEGRSLAGMRVVVDCANGAAYITSPEALRRAGAEVTVINAEPDGGNINVGGGSSSPEVVAKEVVARGADVGLAHDGDADRVIAVDETGQVVDGDAMIAAFAVDMKREGRLRNDLVVATVMANLGFRKAMDAAGISIVETAVGDRYVIEAMKSHDAALGGEQSGHVILSDFTTTGDGLITGLWLLRTMVLSGRRLSEVASLVQRFPQVLLNVKVKDKEVVSASERVRRFIEQSEAAMAGEGRILVRPSGTEPLVRVMVEAPDHETAASVASDIAAVITQEAG